MMCGSVPYGSSRITRTMCLPARIMPLTLIDSASSMKIGVVGRQQAGMVVQHGISMRAITRYRTPVEPSRITAGLFENGIGDLDAGDHGTGLLWNRLTAGLFFRHPQLSQVPGRGNCRLYPLALCGEVQSRNVGIIVTLEPGLINHVEHYRVLHRKQSTVGGPATPYPAERFA